MNLTNVVDIATGFDHSCAVKNDGSAWCWGDNSKNQIGDSTSTNRLVPARVVESTDGTGFLTGVSGIAGGEFHSCAVKTAGTAWCWGENAKGQLGDNTNTNRSTAVVVRIATGQNPPLAGVVEIVAGQLHSCARLSGQTVSCWGFNASGQLGTNNFNDSKVARQTSNLSNAVELTAGHNHTCARRNDVDKTEVCWGSNSSGQLGNNSQANSDVPVAVSSLTLASSIGAGGMHSCASLDTGVLQCWGENSDGQVGDMSNTDRLVPTSVVMACP
jgi:alpha-tubulin suppressor-like RCC1 family protein